jgi:hypothetical protein
MYLDKVVREEMTVRNALGIDGLTIMSADQLESYELAQNYPDEESRILSAIAGDILKLGELGMGVKSRSTEVQDLSCMLDDLVCARTDEEYDAALNGYGSLGSLPSVQKYAEYLRASGQ